MHLPVNSKVIELRQAVLTWVLTPERVIELPKGDFELLKEEYKEPVKTKYESSKTEIKDLIKTLREKGYNNGASYLENLSDRLFTNIEIWLKTGAIAPKITSLLERVFREIGRPLKKTPGDGPVRQ